MVVVDVVDVGWFHAIRFPFVLPTHLLPDSLLLLRFSSFFDIPMYNLPVGTPLPTLPLYLPISILVA
jgi:hypothetical protein